MRLIRTKHEQIINYITDLPIDSKLSVRRISRDLNVSNGTAYRAIKEAENRQLVKTIDRVGTIRVESYPSKDLKQLTIRHVVQLANCKIWGGRQGLDRQVRKFIIAAMQEEAVLTYLAPETVMLVGDREDIQEIALQHNCAVIITGGFEPTPAIIALANERNIPVMTVNFDTFSTATIINKAMIERSIQQDIVLVEDIFIPIEETIYLNDQQTVRDYRRLTTEYPHTRFPVVDQEGCLVGIVTAKDLLGLANETLISVGMTTKPLVARTSMSVVSVTHMMVWDGLELLPVVDDRGKLLGIVTRRDVLKTLEYARHSLALEDRFESLLDEKISLVPTQAEQVRYRFKSDATMVNEVGSLSTSLLAMVIQLVVERFWADHYHKTAIIETVNFLSLHLVQLNSTLDIEPHLLMQGRHKGHTEVAVYHGKNLMAKAFVSVQLPLDSTKTSGRD